MEFIYFISKKEFDGEERQISIAEVRAIIQTGDLQRLQDGHTIHTERGVVWAEEK